MQGLPLTYVRGAKWGAIGPGIRELPTGCFKNVVFLLHISFIFGYGAAYLTQAFIQLTAIYYSFIGDAQVLGFLRLTSYPYPIGIYALLILHIYRDRET